MPDAPKSAPFNLPVQLLYLLEAQLRERAERALRRPRRYRADQARPGPGATEEETEAWLQNYMQLERQELVTKLCKLIDDDFATSGDLADLRSDMNGRWDE